MSLVGLCELIARLKPSAKKLWNKSEDRVFDIGFDATLDHKAAIKLFQPKTMARMAKIGVRLALSVYAYDLKNNSAEQKKKMSAIRSQ